MTNYLYIDIDGVLLQYAHAFQAFMRKKHPTQHYDKNDWYPIDRVKEFQDCREFSKLKPVRGASLWLEYLLKQSKIKVILLTSSIMNNLQAHYRLMNISANFTTNSLYHVELLPFRASKFQSVWQSVCQKDLSNERHILIDDNPEQVSEWIHGGFQGIFFKGDFDNCLEKLEGIPVWKAGSWNMMMPILQAAFEDDLEPPDKNETLLRGTSDDS